MTSTDVLRTPSPSPSGTSAPSSRLAVVGLLLVTVVWGSTFFMLKDVLERVPVTDFLAVRFLLAALVVGVIFPRAVRSLSALECRRGVVLGLAYSVAQLLQTYGIQHTSASVSGFVTGMYVVLTPLLGALLLGVRVSRGVWAAVVVATAGLGVLSLQGLSIGGGEAVTLLGALFYALHIVGLGAWSRAGNVVGLSVIQLATVAGVCSVAAAPGGVVLPSTGADWGVLLWMSLVAGALALLVQTWAQARVSPTRAAIVMTMEPVWAGLFAVLLGGESLGLRVLLGGGLVLVAMYLAELSPAATSAPGEAVEPTPAELIGGVVHIGAP